MCCSSSCCHAVEGLTCVLVFSVLSAVLAMFQVGYNTGVTNAPQRIIEEFIRQAYLARTEQIISEDLKELLWSITVSVFAVGGMIGGITGGSVADRFGRRGGLLLNTFMGIIGASLMGCSKMARSVELLIFGRLIIGFNCGMNTTLVPMYLSEISPLRLRGGLGSVNQLALTLGLLLSNILGIQHILGTEDGWPYLLGLAVLPAVLQLLLMSFCPESPRYLFITKLEETLAKEALTRLRAPNQVEEELEEMRTEQQNFITEDEICPVHQVGPAFPPEERRTITMRQLLQNKSLRLPLVIGIVMQLSQQLSGINAVLYYSTVMFESSGLSAAAAAYATVGVGVILVITALVSVPMMDRSGRRTMHLYGLGGMFIFSIFITISLLVKFLIHWLTYMSVVSTLSFVVCYGIGPGPIPWMITAELFSQGPRPAAMSIAMLVNWLANFVSGLVFPILQRFFDNYTFLPFSALLAIFWTFTYKKIPETKNKTFDEISCHFATAAACHPPRDDGEVITINGLTVPVRKPESSPWVPPVAPKRDSVL